MPRIKDGRQQFQSTFRQVISVTATVAPAAAAGDGTGETIVVAVPGAELGDIVDLGPGADMQDCTFSGYVQAADLVEIRIQNESGGARTIASSTWSICVLKQARD